LVCLILFLLPSQAQKSITLDFHATSPLDSIVVENLHNRSHRSINQGDHIDFCFPQSELPQTSNIMVSSDSRRTGLMVSPNPFHGRTQIEFPTVHSSPCRLSVFDLAGTLVSGMELDPVQGIHRFNISLGSPGVYVCKIADFKNVYTTLLFNTGTMLNETSISYSGMEPPNPDPAEADRDVRGTTLKSVYADDLCDSTAVAGHLLRLSGYSGSAVDVIYDFLTSDSTYEFNVREHEPGVYLHVNDTLPNVPDTIRCLVKSSGYHFAYGEEGGLIFSLDSLVLKPVTHGGKFPPEYFWEIGNPEAWSIDTALISSGVLCPLSLRADTSFVRLYDHANGFSSDFVLITDPEDFVGPGIITGSIKNVSVLDEISGMAASVKNPGGYWVHNDSGDEARIFLIDASGYLLCTVNIDTDFTDNRDWEDICVGPGPVEGETYIYIADIGDLDKKYDNKFIFRISEPEIDMETRGQKKKIPRDSVSTITFDYKYGPRDAEILMIDPLTRDLYIVTKREKKVQVYPIPYPQNYEEKIIITKSTVFLPFRLANGGDISPDGKEILIKNLDTVYYWNLQEGETILDALAREGTRLPYTREPQGEAIAWMRDGSGYLTVSEEKNDITPKIYLYKRQW